MDKMRHNCTSFATRGDEHTKHSSMRFKTFLVLPFLFFFFGPIEASDSLRTEMINGKKVIVHRVEQGQTLFSLARKYNTNVTEIKSLNPTLSQLQIGMEILIPSKNTSVAKEIVSNEAPVANSDPSSVSTQETHTVQQGETLYRIAKQYGISTQELTEANKIGSSGIQLGQTLKIPKKGALLKSNDAAPISNTPPPVDNSKPRSEKKTSASGYPAITESGNAVLDNSIESSVFFSLLHKTAPINTLLIVKNKENGLSVHAKVVGTLKNAPSEATIVAVNKLIYDKLEAKNTSFQVELFYTPEE